MSYIVRSRIEKFTVTPEPFSYDIPFNIVYELVAHEYPDSKIRAIKALRARYTTLGLRDAKEIVEAVQATLDGV
jgi:ribosomal protein L7/L12